MVGSCFPHKGWITGKASGSSKAYARFGLPRTENVLAKFHCALQNPNFSLSQGRLYVFPEHIAFACKIPGHLQSIVTKLSDVSKVRKAKTLALLPNAMEIHKNDGTIYFLTSFLSRNDAYHLIQDLWFVSKGIGSVRPPFQEGDANRPDRDDDSRSSGSEPSSRSANLSHEPMQDFL